jgi:hypothetical protein
MYPGISRKSNDFKLSLGTFSTLYAVRAMQSKYALYKLEPAKSWQYLLILFPLLANGVLDVRGYARRGTGGNRDSPERGCYIVDRWRERFFFTRLTLIFTGLCTTATNNIPCVQDSVWWHPGWTANFNILVVSPTHIRPTPSLWRAQSLLMPLSLIQYDDHPPASFFRVRL